MLDREKKKCRVQYRRKESVEVKDCEMTDCEMTEKSTLMEDSLNEGQVVLSADANVEGKEGEKTGSTFIEVTGNEDTTVLGSENKEDDVSNPGCYAVGYEQKFVCTYCNEKRKSCTQMYIHKCSQLVSATKNYLKNYVKPEILSEERPTTMITSDIIDYRVGMTFYCKNLCKTSLSLSSIKAHYLCCGKTDEQKKKIVKKRKEYYANKVVVNDLASGNEKSESESESESESVSFAYVAPQGDLRSNEEKDEDEEFRNTRDREIQHLRTKNDLLEHEVAQIKRLVDNQLPMAHKSSYNVKFKRLKRTIKEKDRTIKGLVKQIDNSSTPGTIKTKEKNDLSCITDTCESQQDMINMVSAIGAKKTGRLFYHICLSSIHSPYLPFCFLPQDCHLEECDNIYFFKESFKYKNALMMKCIQCQHVFCKVHEHKCKNRSSGRTIKLSEKATLSSL